MKHNKSAQNLEKKTLKILNIQALMAIKLQFRYNF